MRGHPPWHPSVPLTEAADRVSSPSRRPDASARRRICLFTESRRPSGVGVHMLTLARRLKERHTVHVVAPGRDGGRTLLDRAEAIGVNAVALEVRRAKDEPKLRRWLTENEIELLHVHAGIGWEGHAAIYAAREANVRAVVRTEHLPYLITDELQRRDHASLMHLVDRLICVSQGSCSSYAAAGVPEGKLALIRNGIEVPAERNDASRAAVDDAAGAGVRDAARHALREDLGIRSSDRMIVTVARFTRQKGHRVLFDAIPEVLGEVPPARFVLVGDGPRRHLLKRRGLALGIDEFVVYAGDRSDVWDVLSAADLFVLPSLFEGLPLSLLEAMASGIPVVATEVSGTAEVVSDGTTGRLVPPADSKALAAAIVEALCSPRRAARWAAAARRDVAERFSAERMTRETEALYQGLLA